MPDDATFTIGIDLGGTYIKGGVCDASGRLVQRQSTATRAEQGYRHVLARIAELVEQLVTEAGLARRQIAGVGVGTPGPMSHARGVIYGAPNLPGWVNVPARDDLQALIDLPVTLENDANAAAFGEFTAGAARDVQDMVMLTLGTGIGGGVVLGGKLLRGHFDNAGEIGHTIVAPGGRPCPCGQRGCIERYASANAVAERVREAISGGESSALAETVARDEAFDARDVLAAAKAGDALSARIWSETCEHLAVCIVNVQHVLNPEMVVFAGGLINAGDDLLGPVREHFAAQTWKLAPDAPHIALATLGTDAGTIGAAALARD
jgi:glucokinase